MVGRYAVVLLAIAAAGAATVARADDEYGEVSEAVAASAARCSGPWVHPSMAPELEAPLRAGFAIAVERLVAHEACRELFARLGADPFEVLASGLYFPVDSYRREVEVCGRNAVANSLAASNMAYTTVGGRATFLCRQFRNVSGEQAAVVILHEALHHAGLTEWPDDRLAMTSREITTMVEQACGF
jgi:hypothetical protein